jgi:hypothetical protein
MNAPETQAFKAQATHNFSKRVEALWQNPPMHFGLKRLEFAVF